MRFLDERRASSFRLEEGVLYVTDRLGGPSKVIHIPGGFETDLASIPRILPLALHGNRLAAPAVVHDSLYQKGAALKGVTRKRADRIFHDAMKDNRVNRFKAYSYYKFVRVFGWRFYNADT